MTDFAGRALGSGAAAAAAAAAPALVATAAPATSQATVISAFSSAAAGCSAAAAATSSSSSPTTPRQLVWQSFVQHRVLMCVGNPQMLVLACADTASNNNLFFLQILSSASGRQIHPPLLLTAPPFLLSMRSGSGSGSGSRANLGVLLVITCDGLLRVYDLAPNAQGKRLRIQASVRHMLRSGVGSSGGHAVEQKAATPAPSVANKKKPTASSKEDVLTITAAKLSADGQILHSRRRMHRDSRLKMLTPCLCFVFFFSCCCFVFQMLLFWFCPTKALSCTMRASSRGHCCLLPLQPSRAPTCAAI